MCVRCLNWKDLLGERPLVLDREFSYLELLLDLVEVGSELCPSSEPGSHSPRFWDAEGRDVVLALSPGETVIHPGVWYKGKVCVNRIGIWKKGLAEPLWVMSNLEPERAGQIYLCADEHRANLPRFEGAAWPDPADEQAAGEDGKDGGDAAVGLCHRALDWRKPARPPVWAADPASGNG